MCISIENYSGMKFKNNRVLCFGEMLWDRFPGQSKPGGAPMNVALNLRKMGLKPWFASRIGNDDAGKALLDFVKSQNLSTGLIQRGKTLPTGEVEVTLDSGGNASYRIVEPVAWDNIAYTQKLALRAENAGILVFGSLAARRPITFQTLLRVLNTAAFRIMDVNLRPPYDKPKLVQQLLSKSDFVKVNLDELNIIAGWHKIIWLNEEEICRKLTSHYGLSGICVTRGDKGAAMLWGDRWYQNPGIKVEVADTVGAGDAFLAALIYGMIMKHTPVAMLEFASAAGAFVASQKGATPPYTLNDLEDFATFALHKK